MGDAPKTACSKSSSLRIANRNKQIMQPSPPPDVSSSAPPQIGHVEISGAAGCICCVNSCSYSCSCCLSKLRPTLGTSAAVPRPPLRLRGPCRALLHAELRDNACAIVLHRCAKL